MNLRYFHLICLLLLPVFFWGHKVISPDTLHPTIPMCVIGIIFIIGLYYDGKLLFEYKKYKNRNKRFVENTEFHIDNYRKCYNVLFDTIYFHEYMNAKQKLKIHNLLDDLNKFITNYEISEMTHGKENLTLEVLEKENK